jgi:hypothetical protein
MKKLISLCIVLSLFLTASLAAQEIVPEEKPVDGKTARESAAQAKPPYLAWDSEVILPVNLYDTYTFDSAKWPYIRTGMYLFGPVFVTVWGAAEWGWGTQEKFTFKTSHFRGAHALNGASDKIGHAWASYFVKREATFLFRATGSSPLRSNLEGAFYTEAVMTLLEFGDGLSTAQGFDVYDFVCNNIGIAAGLILDQFPVLDRMFALQWEYVPTKRYRRHVAEGAMGSVDFFTDYSGQKYLFTTKLGGIPYLSQTPLRYVNVDLGYYSKGYYNDDFKYSTREMYLGFSINFSMAFGDLLPVGYTSAFLQTTFNYIHLPWDLEAKNWEFTKARND